MKDKFARCALCGGNTLNCISQGHLVLEKADLALERAILLLKRSHLVFERIMLLLEGNIPRGHSSKEHKRQHSSNCQELRSPTPPLGTSIHWNRLSRSGCDLPANSFKKTPF